MNHVKLFARGDGVDGHFCIGRKAHGKDYWEFWNEDMESWCSAGTVYFDKILAATRMVEVTLVEPPE